MSRGQIPFLSVICPFNNCLLQSDFALRRKQPGSQEGQRPPLSANRLPNPPRPTSLRLIPAGPCGALGGMSPATTLRLTEDRPALSSVALCPPSHLLRSGKDTPLRSYVSPLLSSCHFQGLFLKTKTPYFVLGYS